MNTNIKKVYQNTDWIMPYYNIFVSWYVSLSLVQVKNSLSELHKRSLKDVRSKTITVWATAYFRKW